jgi:hypothetical protein
MQRRMQQRIRLVVEERRMAFGRPTEPGFDPEVTIEIPRRAIGRVSADGGC